MKKFIQKYICPNALPSTLILSYVVLVFFTNPFFKIPYDMWEMLMRIESIFYTGKDFTFMPSVVIKEYHLWPWLWAQIFKFLHISDPFAWPYIIHVTQTLILSGSLFFFCWVAFGILLPKNKYRLTLSFFSMLFWIIGTGTFSRQYQQAWIMWYSVNYQCISMSILWLNLGITLLVIYGDGRLKIKILLSWLIILLFVLGLFFHSMEMGFYLMFLALFSSFRIAKYFKLGKLGKKTLWGWVGFIFAVIVTLITFYQLVIRNSMIHIPWSSTFNSVHSVKDLIRQILEAGWILKNGGNRFPNSFSEIAVFSLVAGFLLIPIILKREMFCGEKRYLFFSFLFLAFIFFLIPVMPLINGIFALLTKTGVVYRFFYVSPWFLFIPLGIYFIILKINPDKSFLFRFISLNLVILLILLVCSKCLFYSALFGNFQSIVNSLDKKKVGIQYSKNDIEYLKKRVFKKENHKSSLTPLYYLRGDWARVLASIPNIQVCNNNRFVEIKYFDLSYYRKFLDENRKLSLNPKWEYYKKYQIYQELIQPFDGYDIINLDLPANFPRDDEAFKKFPGMEKSNDRIISIEEDTKAKEKETELQTEIIQSFIFVGRLARIQLLIRNNPEKQCTKDIVLAIKENINSKKSIAKIIVNCTTLNTKNWYTFKFPDYVYLNPKKTYYIVLESPESYPGNAVSVLYSDKDLYKGGEFFINGEKTGGDLCLRIWKGY